jgi:acyl carrier protein
MSTVDTVRKLVADHMGLSEQFVTPETRLVADLAADIQADSLDSIEMLMSIEEEFAIEIGDADAEKCITVADYAALIDRELARQGQA